MKAIMFTRYGPPDVLQLKEIVKHTPEDNQVLVRDRGASVNAYDWRHMRADPFLVRLTGGGLLSPKEQMLGSDFAGQVEVAGKGVRQFQPGDEVYGMGGGFAECVCRLEDRVALKPANLSFEEAAAVPRAGITAPRASATRGSS